MLSDIDDELKDLKRTEMTVGDFSGVAQVTSDLAIAMAKCPILNLVGEALSGWISERWRCASNLQAQKLKLAS